VAALALATVVAARATPPTHGVIVGRVTDAKSGAALAYTNIVVEATPRGAVAGADGRFLISEIPIGVYTLVVSRVGHETQRKTDVIVVGEDTTRVDLVLEPALIEANPVVVTAARTEQTARMAPASVSVLNEAEIAARDPVTFDQAIETIPGLAAFRSTGGISVQSIQIRGSSDVAGGGVGNRVLLLVDGRPALTSDSGGAFWSLVPVPFIDHVEVVKGAFSSLYGSTAMGGVINVITRRPGPLAAGKVEMKLGFFEQPNAGLQYTSATPLQNELNADYSGKLGGTSFLLSASRKESDGYAENTAFTFYDGYGKLLWNLTDSRTLEFTVGGGQAENDYPHAWLNSDQPLEVRDSYADDFQEKTYGNADLWYWGFSGEDLKYSMRAYYYHHEQRSFFNQDDPDQDIPGNEPYGFRTDIDGDKIGNLLQLEAQVGARNRVVVGTDFQLDHVVSSPDSILYGDHQINNYAAFVQDEVMLARTLIATVGARYDWNHLVGDRTLEQLSPKLALVWATTPELSVRALYGQAFRAPTIAEMFTEREIGGGIDFVPNPDLDPERLVFSLEAGVRWSPAALFGLDVAAFRYQYEDLMYFADVSAELGVPFAYQVRNLNSALMQGVEATLQSRWRAVTAFANYTYLDARDESADRTDDLLAYRPDYSAAIGADVEWRRWTLHGDARYRSHIEEVFLYPLQAPDAFWVFNGAAQCEINGAWMLSVKVNNVLDAAYEEIARYRMPGRNWMFGVAMRF
jgi:outer membrane receptor for ferrienterochelin and colicin